MYDFLFDSYVVVFWALAGALLLGAAGGAAVWQTRKKAAALERELADIPHLDSKELYELLHSAVAHELLHGMDNIAGKSRATLEDLPKDQLALRDKQNQITATVQELKQHAKNIMDLYALPQESLQQEMLIFRHLVESVLAKLIEDYAENKAVRLLPNLIDIKPVLLNRDLTLQSLENVIQNAIKYSKPGGVVEVTLSLSDKGPKGGREKWIWIDVKDTGQGIKEEDWEKIFELRRRANGLVEQGSGLGLYLAREAARRQGGDVILVCSKVNEESTFRIILPYNNAGEAAA